MRRSELWKNCFLRSLCYIVNHIELQNVAELCCMSMYTFCRVFKQATDYTFVEYLNHIRLKSAEKLLLSTKLPISEVAYESGFSGLSYFNRKFKEVYSMGPSRYRKIGDEIYKM